MNTDNQKTISRKFMVPNSMAPNHYSMAGVRSGVRSRLLVRLVASLTALLMFLCQSMLPALSQTTQEQTTPANTQSSTIDSRSDWMSDIDIDPPVIDHEALEEGVPGQPQQFTANVVDDRGLKRVWLFYRSTSGAQYSSEPMEQVPDSSEYIVTVDTQLAQRKIEYYIEAVDTGGNRVLKGFPFFPLVRQLTPAPGQAVATTEPATAKNNTALYLLLGVAAVGVALALANQDDDPDETTPPPPGPGTVPLNIIVDEP